MIGVLRGIGQHGGRYDPSAVNIERKGGLCGEGAFVLSVYRRCALFGAPV